MERRILIVDDHAGFRAQARRLLESEGYLVVGEAADCVSALAAARTLEPELALVDVCLPDGNGFDLATRLGQLPSPPAIVMTSSHDAAEVAPAAGANGARGFVPKADLSRSAIEQMLA